MSPPDLRIKLYERDPAKKIVRPSDDKPANPRYLETLTLPWTDDVDTVDRRRAVARATARAHLGNRDPAINHARDAQGDLFIAIVDKPASPS